MSFQPRAAVPGEVTFDDEVGGAQAAAPLNLGGVADDAGTGLHHGADGRIGSGRAAPNQAHVAGAHPHPAGLLV